MSTPTGLPDQVVFMRQVHGGAVAYVTAPGVRPEVDAVFTDQRGLALRVVVADCAPVLITTAGMVGAAHSGRTGTVAGVVPALVRAMAGRGADVRGMTAWIGPNACGSCYEVPPQMRADVTAAVPHAWATTRHGTPSVDIRAGIVGQLTALGVTDIQHDDRCTIESPQLWSYRRDRRSGGNYGFVWLD
ncbi:peptidoglycan editing factor PgeF [Actinocrispum wychmicini]|uniref:Purine nucleoside phosphorylase n=1 Tax=Actinocrispum wychmicini TaxID=1213861 RepID=A0A4R2JUP8_9PSEU|nr:peptidoglycan editing factor PgeF [Actinocrispum wychmicini]TCO60996.1 hypothetical protein EV192_103579 [Actinocrispum wychmicini]